MSDEETFDRRLRAVERSLTNGDHEVDALRDADDVMDRVETLEAQLSDVDDRLTELEAVTQALRGYVGNVRSVNEDVEQRADAALAAVERLEDELDSASGPPSGTHRSPVRQPARERTPAQRSVQQGETGEQQPDESGGDGSFLRRLRGAFG